MTFTQKYFQPLFAISSSVKEVHRYNTRFASKHSYCIPKAKTNYGKFNIRFIGSKVWNSIQDDLKFKRRTSFKNNLKSALISEY